MVVYGSLYYVYWCICIPAAVYMKKLNQHTTIIIIHTYNCGKRKKKKLYLMVVGVVKYFLFSRAKKKKTWGWINWLVMETWLNDDKYIFKTFFSYFDFFFKLKLLFFFCHFLENIASYHFLFTSRSTAHWTNLYVLFFYFFIFCWLLYRCGVLLFCCYIL